MTTTRSEARLQESLAEITRMDHSVLLTFITDGMGFFLFLGLAAVVLA